jgi:hypothetical protein
VLERLRIELQGREEVREGLGHRGGSSTFMVVAGKLAENPSRKLRPYTRPRFLL